MHAQDTASSSLSRFACRRARTGNAYSHRRTNRWASHRRPYATHKGWYRLRISSGIGRRIGTVSWSNCTLKVASSIGSEAPPTWANGLANSIAISKPTAPLLAGETRRDHTPHSATIAPLSAAVPEADSSPQPDAKTPLSSLPKQATEGRRSFQEHQGKGLGMRRPKAGTNRSGSTELMAALIARDSARTDGTYVLYLQDPKPRP